MHLRHIGHRPFRHTPRAALHRRHETIAEMAERRQELARQRVKALQRRPVIVAAMGKATG